MSCRLWGWPLPGNPKCQSLVLFIKDKIASLYMENSSRGVEEASCPTLPFCTALEWCSSDARRAGQCSPPSASVCYPATRGADSSSRKSVSVSHSALHFLCVYLARLVLRLHLSCFGFRDLFHPHRHQMICRVAALLGLLSWKSKAELTSTDPGHEPTARFTGLFPPIKLCDRQVLMILFCGERHLLSGSVCNLDENPSKIGVKLLDRTELQLFLLLNFLGIPFQATRRLPSHKLLLKRLPLDSIIVLNL